MGVFAFDEADEKVQTLRQDRKIPFSDFVSQMGSTFERIYRLAEANFYEKSMDDIFADSIRDYLKKKHGDIADEGPETPERKLDPQCLRPKIPFTPTTKVRLGGYLAEVAVNTLMDRNTPILEVVNEREGKRLKGYVRISEKFIEDLLVPVRPRICVETRRRKN